MEQYGFGIIKPDGLEIAGKIFSIFWKNNIQIFHTEPVMLDKMTCREHYKKDEAWFLKKGERRIQDRLRLKLPITMSPREYGMDIIEQVVTQMTSSEVIIFVPYGEDVIARGTELVGDTEPASAGPETIRGRFGKRFTYAMAEQQGIAVPNITHWATSLADAEREKNLWKLGRYAFKAFLPV